MLTYLRIKTAAHGVQETVLEIGNQINNDNGYNGEERFQVSSAFAKGYVKRSSYEKNDSDEGDN